MPNVKMSLAGSSLGGGVVQTNYSGNVVAGSDGIVTVDSRDALELLRAGATYVGTVSKWQGISACRAGSAGRIVASAALSNGSMTVANQPDVGRVCNLRIDPGAAAITAGLATLTYTANDGTTQVDALSLVTASAVLLTQPTTKGVMHLTSAVVTVLAGGASPKMQIDDTNALALAVDPGFVDFAVIKENVDGADETIGTVNAAAGAVTPTTAPNATHTFGFGFTYLAPSI